MQKVSSKYKETIYSLASHARHIADLPEMAQRRQKWSDHNSLKASRSWS